MRENYCTAVRGSSVALVPYRRRFVPRYHAWMKDPWIREMTASEPLSLEEEYAMQRSWRDDSKKLTFIVMDAAHPGALKGEIDAMAGDVNLFFNDRDDPKVAEVEVMIAEEGCRRRGMATAAVGLLLWYSATHHSIRRFYCKIGEANAASLALFEKLGFTRCGYSEAFAEVELEWRPPQREDGSSAMDPPAEFQEILPYAEEEEEGGGEENKSAGDAGVQEPPETADATKTPAATSSGAAASPTVSTVRPKVGIRQFSGVVGDGVIEVGYMPPEGSCRRAL